MADHVSKTVRSAMMSAVRATNTKPEIAIRRALFAYGFRFRLHRRDLPGSPDLVLPKHSAIVFVHGCFWHQHGCARSRLPSSRNNWWRKKLNGNAARDRYAIKSLRAQGWRVLVIWECALRGPVKRRESLVRATALKATSFLRSNIKQREIPSSLRVGSAHG